ncbi:type IV pilus modification PilV family protein [Bifidobacterium pongonis]|uniref:type IV pilus modification PilV family protein n=1 Tax=Bifidobacterium pongonis TaxID=2834432 RepID=UPI001F34A7E4|nr:prepilin-type N-terminal cleavage/methylation domain-containing protein [Bifidobacterium pongonis]
MPKRGERGFTLVETIVAVIVLSLVGLAAAQFAVTAVRTSYAQQLRSTAVSLGDDGVERVQAQIASVKSDSYFEELTKGMSQADVKEAYNALLDAGAFTSSAGASPSVAQNDIGYASSADGSDKYIHPARTTQGKDFKQSSFNVYTVVEKAYRLSGTMQVKTASEWGLPDHGLDYVGGGDASADVNNPTKAVTKAFKSGSSHTYVPVLRVVVGVTWPDNISKNKTCIYTTSTLLDVAPDQKIIV